MKLFKKEFPDFPGRNKKISLKKAKEYKVACNITREQTESLRGDFGIDVVALVEDAIANESMQSILKNANQKCFKSRGININGDDEFDNLLVALSEGGKGYIITSIGVGAAISYSDKYLAEPLETMYTAALMYKQGMIGNYELYIDPYMEYSDTRLAVVHGNFYNFKEVEDTKLISEGTMAPRVVVSVKFKAKKPNSIVFNINDIKGIIK